MHGENERAYISFYSLFKENEISNTGILQPDSWHCNTLFVMQECCGSSRESSESPPAWD